MDISIQYCGGIASLFALAIANGISPTDALLPGQDLEIPDDTVLDEQITSYFRHRNLLPASAYYEVESNDNYELFPLSF